MQRSTAAHKESGEPTSRRRSNSTVVRVPPDEVISWDVAQALCRLSLRIRRPISVLLTRRGVTRDVIIGTELSLPDSTLAKGRDSVQSLCGLRLLETQLRNGQ
ncbi:MAG: hypothetical protein ICV75_03835 [Nitrospiraceae bacterium]|nr:hypothetical protein [Nitrospiraceae bacterium]